MSGTPPSRPGNPRSGKKVTGGYVPTGGVVKTPSPPKAPPATPSSKKGADRA